MTILDRDSEGLLHWDDRTWQVLPPPTSTDDFDDMEVPQLLKIMGRYYLFFSVSMETRSQPHRQTGRALIGIYYMVANNPQGPFSAPKVLFASPVRHLYSGKLVQGPEPCWYFSCAGALIEPLPVTVDDTGLLHVLTQVAG